MQTQEITAKLRASRSLLTEKLHQPDAYILVEDVKVVYERYAEMRTILQSESPFLFGDLPEQPIPRQEVVRVGKPAFGYEHIYKLIHDIDYCLNLLSSINSNVVPPSTVTREGMFFSGQFFDALLKITDLISQAQKSIVLIDGYINKDVLDLLTEKASGVTVNILTKNVVPALVVVANAFNKQYGGLSIRTSQAFHDRFVITDDRDFYHFGASLKHLGNRGFMFSRIEEPFVINALRIEFTKEWAGSTVVV